MTCSSSHEFLTCRYADAYAGVHQDATTKVALDSTERSEESSSCHLSLNVTLDICFRNPACYFFRLPLYI